MRMAVNFVKKCLHSGRRRYIFVLVQSHGGVGVNVMKDMAIGMKAHSFFEKEDRCKRVFDGTLRKYGGIWHLCTPGEKQPIVFKNPDDYAFAMTLVAMCAYDCPNVQVITFEIMSNHVHFVLCGSKADVNAFFELFKKRLLRYLTTRYGPTDLTNFKCDKPIAIETVESMRNQICYTNRNNFVVDPDQTPFSYPYGANSYYFMPVAQKQIERRFGDLTLREKRNLIHAREPAYPDDYIITDGYFSPMNYCHVDIGEAVFRDARHYFNKLAKDIEAYREIAAEIGDTIFYTDDELFEVVKRLCKEKYENQRPSLLGKNEKLDLARKLHYDYNADNAKISRMLNLQKTVLDQLFPSRLA